MKEKKNNIKEYSILGKTVFIHPSSGFFSFNRFEILQNFAAAPNFDLFRPNFLDYNAETTSITFCINISDACNLRCDYCFNALKKNKSLRIETILDYLVKCFNAFPNKEKYYVDLSGKGEPLLFLQEILEIKKFCDAKSNEINREILVQFVCNGTLLDEITASILQKNGILFGVSLDGNEMVHNKHRKTKDGKPTYQAIINNVKNIQHHEYVGVACTLTKDVFSLKESILELSKIFNTISYKPCRDCDFSIDSKTIESWNYSYDELVTFLLKESIRGNLKYIKILLNGEDYLGKFIKRIFLGQRCIIRCDAGIGRFALDEDGKIYACPASFKLNKMLVGDSDRFFSKKIAKLFDIQRKKDGCQKCDFRHFCGGECLIEKTISKGINKTMCKYKTHLILLAMFFASELWNNNHVSYVEIYNFCVEVDNRRKLDKELNIYFRNLMF